MTANCWFYETCSVSVAGIGGEWLWTTDSSLNWEGDLCYIDSIATDSLMYGRDYSQ